MNDFEMTLISQDRINRLRAEADRSRLAAHGRDQQARAVSLGPAVAPVPRSPHRRQHPPSICRLTTRATRAPDHTVATHRPASWDPYHRDP